MDNTKMAESKSPVQKEKADSGSTPIKVQNDENGKPRFVCEKDLSNENAIKQVTGTKDYDLGIGILASGAGALTPIGLTSGSLADNVKEGFNMILRSLNDFKPQDAVEARLTTQASVAFEYAMNMVRRGAGAEMIHHLETYTNLGIKFMRAHNETIDALNRYRRGGEQKVTVTHIAEKMAVVNNYGGGGGNAEKQETTS